MTEKKNVSFATNPFPATAVARLSQRKHHRLTVETDALKKMRLEVEDFFANQKGEGKTVCVIGEYGTGKTHLLLETLHSIIDLEDETIHAFYVDAPSDSFLSLYQKRFLPRLERYDVQIRLREIFRQVVIGELESDPIFEKVVSNIRNGKLEVDSVIKQYGLMESNLLQQFSHRLKGIAEDECFSAALFLLNSPIFQEDVWDWLEGNPPTKALQERGITRVIDNDPIALESIGVFAFLLGQEGHKFVLMIDELEKVISSSQEISASTTLAFKKLFEAISKTKALLILSGLQDFYETMPIDAQERVSAIIRPTLLNGKDIVQYIREANFKYTAQKTIEPFSRPVIDYIASISGGNARKTIRICYHAYQIATSENVKVSRKIIQEVTQDQFGTQTEGQVKEEILGVIERMGLAVEHDKRVERSQVDKKTYKLIQITAKADYWIAVGNDNTGIAITHVHDVFSDNDEKQIIDRATNLSYNDDKGIHIASILVVSGFIAESRSVSLSKFFDKVIPYTSREFTDHFESALSGFRIRIEERLKEDKLDLILTRMRQIERQISITNRQLDSLATKSDINTLIQLVRANDTSGFALSPRTRNDELSLEFRRIFNAFDSIDRLILEPLNTLPNRRSSSIYIDFLSSTNGLSQFYLMHGLTMIYYYAQIDTREDEGLVLASVIDINYRLSRGFREAIENSFRNWDYPSFASYVSETSRLRPESILIDAENLIKSLQLLPDRIINLLEKRQVQFDSASSDTLRGEPTEYSNFLVSRFAELNDTFFNIQNGLNTIMQLLLQNPQRFIADKLEERFADDLQLFFYLYRMSFLFIEIVVSRLESSLFDSTIEDLREFCPVFDDILARGSKTHRKSARLGILRYLERTVSVKSMRYQETRDLDDLISEIFDMPRNTYKELDNIHSRYSLGKR